MPPALPGTARLLRMDIVLPIPPERDRLAERVRQTGQEPRQIDGAVLIQDPSGNPVALTAQGGLTDLRPSLHPFEHLKKNPRRLGSRDGVLAIDDKERDAGGPGATGLVSIRLHPALVPA